MSNTTLLGNPGLHYQPGLLRNQANRLLTILSCLFAAIAILPLIAVIGYVLVEGISVLRPAMFVELPPAPGFDEGGIGNAFVGTLIITGLSCLFAIPIGVGGGIYLSEYGNSNRFSSFIGPTHRSLTHHFSKPDLGSFSLIFNLTSTTLSSPLS